MPQTDPNNGKRATERKRKRIKVSKSNRISGKRDRYHKRPQECVMDRHTYGDQNRIIIETGSE